MALTEEQIKNLKPGDPVIIHGTFVKVMQDGDICMKSTMTFFDCVDENDLKYAHPSVVSIDKPKYDPCRPFRGGDEVRFRKVNGNNARCRYNGIEITEGSLGKIVKEEGRNCFWVKFGVHCNWCLDAAYFELVTPVEEQMPYSIDPANSNVLFKHGKKFATFEDDDEAQDICNRLNAEWRKEQNNDRS